jgi:phage shock protein PspC (stress-responsive transcriptional regulator)
MRKDNRNKWFGGVLAGIAYSIGVSASLLRIIFIVCFLGVGGITLGISSFAMAVIYFICWAVME